MVFFGDVCKSRFQKTTHGQSCDSNRPCFGAKTKKKIISEPASEVLDVRWSQQKGGK